MFRKNRKYEVRRVGTENKFVWVVFKKLSGGQEIWMHTAMLLEQCINPDNYPTAKVIWSNPADESERYKNEPVVQRMLKIKEFCGLNG